jgi:FixJ family two-component response regulator
VIKAIEVGAADFIVKPINQEDVLAKISKCL